MARFDHDVTILADLIFSPTSTVGLPDNTVKNGMVSPTDPLDANKTDNSYRAVLAQNDSAEDETKYAFMARGAGTFLKFRVIQKTACAGLSKVTVDVKKNGVSIINAVITLDSSSAINTPIAGIISTGTFAADDYIEIIINATASGTDALATRVMAQLDYDEDYTA